MFFHRIAFLVPPCQSQVFDHAWTTFIGGHPTNDQKLMPRSDRSDHVPCFAHRCTCLKRVLGAIQYTHLASRMISLSPHHTLYSCLQQKHLTGLVKGIRSDTSKLPHLASTSKFHAKRTGIYKLLRSMGIRVEGYGCPSGVEFCWRALLDSQECIQEVLCAIHVLILTFAANASLLKSGFSGNTWKYRLFFSCLSTHPGGCPQILYGWIEKITKPGKDRQALDEHITSLCGKEGWWS